MPDGLSFFDYYPEESQYYQNNDNEINFGNVTIHQEDVKAIFSPVVNNGRNTEIGNDNNQLVEFLGKAADTWFDPKEFEGNGELYEKLGVRLFKRWMPTNNNEVVKHFWNPLFKKFGSEFKYLENTNSTSLEGYNITTRVLEAIHAGFFVAYTGLMVDALVRNDISSAVFFAATQIPVNIYPIMVQRYNRIRINRALDRINKVSSLNENQQNNSKPIQQTTE